MHQSRMTRLLSPCAWERFANGRPVSLQGLDQGIHVGRTRSKVVVWEKAPKWRGKATMDEPNQCAGWNDGLRVSAIVSLRRGGVAQLHGFEREDVWYWFG